MENAYMENKYTHSRTYGLKSRRGVFADATNRQEEEPTVQMNTGIQKAARNSFWRLEMLKHEGSNIEDASDIYACQKNNHLYETEYLDDLYQNMKKKEAIQISERIQNDFLRRQTQIRPETRAVMVNWLVFLNHKLDLSNDVLQLSVKILDELTARKAIPKKKYQLLAAVSNFIAAKYVEHFAPMSKYYIRLAENSFTKDEMLHLEEVVLNILEFRIEYITPHEYFDRFLRAAGVIGGDDDVFHDYKLNNLLSLLDFLSELILTEYDFAKYPPSQIAASIVWIVMKHTNPNMTWSTRAVRYTEYSTADLKPCIIDIGRLWMGESTRGVKNVRKKYSNPRFGRISTHPIGDELRKLFEHPMS